MKNVALKLEDETFETLNFIAKESGLYLSEICRYIIEGHIENGDMTSVFECGVRKKMKKIESACEQYANRVVNQEEHIEATCGHNYDKCEIERFFKEKTDEQGHKLW